MTKKVLVSVGIPVYNEEKNIAKVLRAILNQTQEDWILKEIVVYSDGSTDNTILNAHTVKDKHITIIDDKTREGKVSRVESIYKKLSGDVFVMFDGDVKILSNNVISCLIEKLKDNNTVLVGGNAKVFFPRTFVERGVYATFKVYYQTRISIKNGDNVFASCGICYAIKAKFAKSIHFPKIKNEDAFLYLLCISKGYSFAFARNAVIYYNLPKTLHDYLSQVFRSNPEAVTLSLEKHFGSLVKKEFTRGVFTYLKNVLSVLLEDPLPTLFIIFVNFATKPLFRFISNPNKLTWESVKSTKII